MIKVPPVVRDFTPEAKLELERIYAFLQASPGQARHFHVRDAVTDDVISFMSESGGTLDYCPSCDKITAPNRPCMCD